MTSAAPTRIKLQNQSANERYLTAEEIETIIADCKKLSKGQKRDAGTPMIWVRVDAQSFNINSYSALKSLIGACYINPSEFEMFRNFNKGVTIKLEK
jgi:hypothetical protein